MPTRKKPKYLEALEQRLFIKRWRMDPRTKHLPATAVPNGVRTSPIQAALAKADGMEAGVPDWLLFEESEDGYHGLALEFKNPNGKGKVSPAQADWHKKLVNNGWCVEIVTSADQAWKIVTDYLGMNAEPRQPRQVPATRWRVTKGTKTIASGTTTTEV